jgi:hypothetical protein
VNLTIEIPDDLVGWLNAAGGDLSRRALGALALEEYTEWPYHEGGSASPSRVHHPVGTDGLPKAHEAWADHTISKSGTLKRVQIVVATLAPPTIGC